MGYKEFEGKTVDEAIVAAMRTFRVGYEDLEIKVISEGSKGVFGIGGKNAKIEARLITEAAQSLLKDDDIKIPEVPMEEENRDSFTETPREVLDDAVIILREMLKRMHMDFDVVIEENGMLQIKGDGSGLLIGKHGQTLEAVQFILNRILSKKYNDMAHIAVDTEGYRQRHIDTLRTVAERMSQKAKKMGRPITLENMNPHDRRIIHLTLKEDNSVSTKSIGNGLLKKVVIIPKRTPR